jgi:hypothetical protein
MAPFHLPWTTFSAFLVLLGTIALALIWAALDKLRDESAKGEDSE